MVKSYIDVCGGYENYMLHVIVFAVDSSDTNRISIPYQCSRTSRIEFSQNPTSGKNGNQLFEKPRVKWGEIDRR